MNTGSVQNADKKKEKEREADFLSQLAEDPQINNNIINFVVINS